MSTWQPSEEFSCSERRREIHVGDHSVSRWLWTIREPVHKNKRKTISSRLYLLHQTADAHFLHQRADDGEYDVMKSHEYEYEAKRLPPRPPH